MLDARVLVWTPPSAPRPVAKAPPRPAPPPIVPRDFVSELRALLKPFIDRGVGLDTALDSVDQQAVMRATTAYAARGGQASGARSVAGFRAAISEAST